MQPVAAAISVAGLVKRYGDHDVVAGLDLEVQQGEVFAFLGRNGAGKTTTTEILEGYRTRDAGSVSVLGEDPASAGASWRAKLGIVLQESRPLGALTVKETLRLYAAYFPQPRPVAEVIALVGLDEQADQRAGRLSGGQARRLDVAVALIGRPQLVFLDEPTTGFDPEARRQFWSVIAGLRDLGTTVFLTTHYMDEAQVLADRVGVLRGGRLAALGTPAELQALSGFDPSVTFPEYVAPPPPPRPMPPPGGFKPPPVTSTSTPLALALAKHLKASGATFYGAHWCVDGGSDGA